MQYWDVFIIITAIVGLFATVLPFFTKLHRMLGELNANIEQIKKTMATAEANRRETHNKIFDKLDNHETRIARLE